MRKGFLTMATVLAMTLLHAAAADAGCGCAKPPPVRQVVRPAFASPGDVVTIFPPENRAGEYEMRIGEKKIKRWAAYKRDLADGQYRWQIAFAMPPVAAGPRAIEVRGPGPSFTIPSSDFTVMQAPLVLEESDGETVATCYSAAVTADNVVLIPLDITAISDHMIFNGFGAGYPLLFGAADVMIYNTQGFLMQLLTPADAGIFEIEDLGAPDSLALTYDRHEFDTYREQHNHVGGLGLDPWDRAWHLDGTYHVDHNRLVLAIKGTVENQGPPPAGTTPSFDFRVATALASASGGPTTVRTIQWSTACSASSSSGN